MGLLYSRRKTTTDTYTFKINTGGGHGVMEGGEVTVVFKDNKFKSAQYPFSGTHGRNGWRVLGAINDEINRIEEEIATIKPSAASGE